MVPSVYSGEGAKFDAHILQVLEKGRAYIEKGAQHPRERKKSRNSNKIQKLALSKSFPHKALGTKMENTNTGFKNRGTL